MAKNEEVTKNKLYEVSGESSWSGRFGGFLGTKIAQLLVFGIFAAAGVYLAIMNVWRAGGTLAEDLQNPVNLVFIALGILVFGFGFCWAATIGVKWNAKNTIVNGQRLKYTGSTLALFFACIKWGILCIITVGIYFLYLPVAIKKWKYRHMTSVEDDASIPQNQVTYYIVD